MGVRGGLIIITSLNKRIDDVNRFKNRIVSVRGTTSKFTLKTEACSITVLSKSDTLLLTLKST